MKSPIAQVLRQLIHAPDPPEDQVFTRVRLMERDIVLTIKVITLSILSYIIYTTGDQPSSDMVNELIDDLKQATFNGVFLGYIGFSAVSAIAFLAMPALSSGALRWLVYVVVIVDAIFTAILINLTADADSPLYFIFMFLIVRNAVSISHHRFQIAINALVILCFIMGPIASKSLENFGNQILQPANTELTADLNDLGTNTPPEVIESGLSNSIRAFVDTLVSSNIAAVQTGDDKLEIETEALTFRESVLTAFLQVTEPRKWQSKLDRILTLCLLAMCCYGITVLWNTQLLTREEEQEFATRQHQLRSTGRLAAEIAHQIKNPLAIINNAAFSLGRALKESPEPVHAKIRMIQEEVERSDQILTELMGYAKLAEGRVERLNLRDELDRAVEQVFPTAFDQKVKIYVDCPNAFPPMLMQQGHLNEILVNLLTNARDALNNEGYVEINAVENPKKQVILTVLDNGPGFPSERLDKVFEPYFSTKEKGAGLGLAIVKHNVEMYGGSVRAESGLGNGTKFTLVFPFKVIVPVDK